MDFPKVIPWLLWRIWKARNEFIFKGITYNAQETVRKELEDANEWSSKTVEHEHRSTPLQQRMVKWRQPPTEWVKCNTDGARQEEGTQSGIGWALRNHEGSILWLGAKALRKTRSVLEVELEALRWAILTMTRFNYQKIIFESDSLEAVNLVNSGEIWSAYAPILQDIKLLLLQFQAVKVSYISREGNGVADRVAKESISFENYDPKLYSLMPNWIKHYVLVDKPVV